ncbi:MAG: endonuclease NucS [bacterium]|nr:endonuclease NucS [bacterium]
MFKVDVSGKNLIPLVRTTFSNLKLKERFDIQEWVEKRPDILGEDILIISKELILPSGRRLDLLGLDSEGRLVVIELKKDDTGADVDWQSIKYVACVANFSNDDIIEYFAKYQKIDVSESQRQIEVYLDKDCDIESMNQEQRIIIASKEFNSEVISAVLWLRNYDIDIKCVRLEPYLDVDSQLFLKPEIIIPLPEAKDYILERERRQREDKQNNERKRSESVLPFLLRTGMVKVGDYLYFRPGLEKVDNKDDVRIKAKVVDKSRRCLQRDGEERSYSLSKLRSIIKAELQLTEVNTSWGTELRYEWTNGDGLTLQELKSKAEQLGLSSNE